MAGTSEPTLLPIGAAASGALLLGVVGAGEVAFGSAAQAVGFLGVGYVLTAGARVVAAYLLVGAIAGVAAGLLSPRLGRGRLSALPWAAVVGLGATLATFGPLRATTSGWPPVERLLAGGAWAAASLVLAFVAVLWVRGRLGNRVRTRALVATAGVAALLSVLGVGAGLAGSGARWASAERPNVILISLDTTRADHLQSYGYARETSPQLLALSEQSVVFDRAFAPEPWTLPSHMTMFTAQYPLAHGVLEAGSRLHPDTVTLAEALGAAGYRTMAFVASGPDGYVGASHGFGDGFDAYQHPPHHHFSSLGSALFDLLALIRGGRLREVTAEQTVEEALHFVDAVNPDPFFLFLHFYDAHSDFSTDPYDASEADIAAATGGHPNHFEGCDGEGRCASNLLKSVGPCPDDAHERLDPEVMDDVVRHYDGGIRYLDRQLGRLFDALREREVLDNSVLLITADHGESFREHDFMLHRESYNNTLWIPFMLRLPGGKGAGTRVDTPVSLVDVMPTLLDASGVQVPDGGEGRSLVSAATSPGLELTDVFVSNSNNAARVTRELGIISGGHKLVLPLSHPCGVRQKPDEVRVFDVGDDMPEQRDLLGDLPRERLRELRGRLRRWHDRAIAFASRHGAATQPRVEMDPETRKRLEALGYLGK